jgi:hypothetical protein
MPLSALAARSVILDAESRAVVVAKIEFSEITPQMRLANRMEHAAASGTAAGIETGQQLPFSHAAAGVGRSKPTNATPSAATAFSACRPEDAKSYPNKMFELSGFRDATTAGNLLRQKSSGKARRKAPFRFDPNLKFLE